jgi:hypothetical protein
MKKIILGTILAAASTGLLAQSSSVASKETGFYAELGFAQAYYSESNDAYNFNNSMAVLKAGYSINKYIAVEVMGAGNLSTANFNVGSTRFSAKVSDAYGGYGKFSLPVNDDLSFFVRLGVTSATVSATASNGSRTASAWSSGSDFSYGGGVQFNFTKEIYGQIDYMSYYNKNNITVTAPSISIGYKF